MDQKGQQNLKTLSQFTKSLFLKKITQLLLSVSVFSLLLSSSSRLSFLHPFNSHFSTFPIQLFSHTLDKNYIFLICNGLLVFVAKFSGLISSSWNTNHGETLGLESKVTLLEKEVLMENTFEAKENIELLEEAQEEIETKEDIPNDGKEIENEFSVLREERKESEVVFFVKEEGEGEVIELDNETPSHDEEEEDDDEGNAVLSTEELNKRFDEFIRRMKEELRIEAQQQLILVK